VVEADVPLFELRFQPARSNVSVSGNALAGKAMREDYQVQHAVMNEFRCLTRLVFVLGGFEYASPQLRTMEQCTEVQAKITRFMRDEVVPEYQQYRMEYKIPEVIVRFDWK